MFKRYILNFSLVAIVTCVFYVLCPAYMEYSNTRQNLLEEDINLLNQQRTNESLRKKIHRLKTDPRAIERVAREKFFLCKDGEKIYDFSE